MTNSYPAAQIDGGQFVAAAEKYKLPNDNTTLNQIVDLVNSGVDLDAAAKTVAQRRGSVGGSVDA